MKNRKFVYLFAFLFTLTLVAPVAVAAPEHPDLLSTSLEGVEPEDAAAGAEFTLEATLKGEDPDTGDMEPIAGEDVEFTFDGETIIDVTDENGEASATFTAPDTEDTYDYTVFVDEFVKDDYNYDYTTEESTVTVSTGAEVRAENPSKEDHLGSRVEGRYRLRKTTQFYRTGPKRGSCVFIHIYTHSAPGGGLVD